MKKTVFYKIIHHLPELIAGVALIWAITITVVNGLTRYILGFTFAGSDELVVLGFGWTVFPGCAAVFRLKMHMGIDALVKIFPTKTRQILDFCLEILILFINAFMIYLGFFLAYNAWGKILPATGISYFYLDMALVVGFAFMTWYSIGFIRDDIIKFRTKSPSQEGILA